MNESLPPMRRLILIAVIMPAVIVAANMMLLKFGRADWVRTAFYPFLAANVAALSFFSGTFLRKTWLSWVVFAWSLILLDLLTYVSCLDGTIPAQFGYILVSSQISLLVLWAILGPGHWQWRLPGVAAVSPFVAMFTGSFAKVWNSQYWDLMMLLTTAVVAILCGGLRFLGFVLQNQERAVQLADGEKRRTIQFGMKHMLIWLTVTGPLVLMARGIDFTGQTFFPQLLLALSVATVNLIAIWAVLGGGFWMIRIVALCLVPYLIGSGLAAFSGYMKSFTGRGQSLSIAHALVDMQDLWIGWMWLDAALLGALLLFLRASDYRLARAANRKETRK